MISWRPALFPATIGQSIQHNQLIYMDVGKHFRQWPRSVWGETINFGVKTIRETLNNSPLPRNLRDIDEESQQAGLLFDQCSAF